MEPATTPVLTPWAKLADVDRKKRFAALIRSRANNAQARMEAGFLVFPEPEEQNLAAKAATEWHLDPIVIAEVDRLSANTPGGELPSAEQQARDVYNLASDTKAPVDDRLKAHKLYAEIRGFVKKPGDGAGVTNIIDNRRVMIMPAAPKSIDDWETDAMAQQHNLVVAANAGR